MCPCLSFSSPLTSRIPSTTPAATWWLESQPQPRHSRRARTRARLQARTQVWASASFSSVSPRVRLVFSTLSPRLWRRWPLRGAQPPPCACWRRVSARACSPRTRRLVSRFRTLPRQVAPRPRVRQSTATSGRPRACATPFVPCSRDATG